MRKIFPGLAGLAVMAAGAAGLANAASSAGDTFIDFAAQARRMRASGGRLARNFHKPNGSIATGNRHGGPHEHKREITRRLRQAARHG